MSHTPEEFFKMSAAGNDFIVFDHRAGGGLDGFPERVRRLCARGLSVGADGVILLERSERADVRVRFFNPDGGATFCGNGARCAARLAFLHGAAPARMTVETDLGLHRAEVTGTTVSFEMRDPRGFEAIADLRAEERLWSGCLVDTGVPHFVVLEAVPAERSIETWGRALRRHARFGAGGANVNFVGPNDAGAFSIRTYERGVEGETLACGSGCVAAALVLADAGRAQSPVTLVTRSGDRIRVLFEGEPRAARGVRLEGEARLVFVGNLSDEAVRGFSPAR